LFFVCLFGVSVCFSVRSHVPDYNRKLMIEENVIGACQCALWRRDVHQRQATRSNDDNNTNSNSNNNWKSVASTSFWSSPLTPNNSEKSTLSSNSALLSRTVDVPLLIHAETYFGIIVTNFRNAVPLEPVSLVPSLFEIVRYNVAHSYSHLKEQLVEIEQEFSVY
jgi:hypothetical protein